MSQTEIIQHNELINRIVIERNSAEQVGYLEQLWLDPQAHHIRGLTAKSGLLGRDKHYFTWTQVETIGEDGILVHGSLSKAKTPPAHKMETVIGHELWTTGGNKAGKIVDYLFRFETGEVTGYLFASNGWRGVLEGIYLLPPIAISSVGEKRVIALENAVQDAEQYSQGVSERVEKTRSVLAEDYDKTRQDLQGAMNQASEKANQFRENLQARFKEKKDDSSQ